MEFLNHNNEYDNSVLLKSNNMQSIGNDGFGKSCKELEKELKGLESIISLKNRSFEQRLQQLVNESKAIYSPSPKIKPEEGNLEDLLPSLDSHSISNNLAYS